MFLMSKNRWKTFAVCFFFFLFLFFCCFAISNANDDSLSLRLLELLEERERKNLEEKDNSLTELNNFRKSIETNEIISDELTCPSGHFLCSSSSSSSSSSSVRCIYDDWVCDGENDCKGGEDELNCHKLKDCPNEGMFRCSSDGRCLPPQWFCDGDRDCPDGSDELLCHSSTTRRPHRAGCPPGSNYVAEFNQCYSPLVDVFVDQREAGAVCRQFHPNAHLPAILNNEQDLFIRHLILKEKPELCPMGVWTSGRRSNSFRPFTWHLPSSTSPAVEEEKEDRVGGGGERTHSEAEREQEEQRALNYTNWIGEKPRIGFGQRENCLFIDRKNAFKWNQRRCEHLLCVICQLDLH